MYLTIPIDLYDDDYILFTNKKKNIILENSYFTKILYSSNFITINGLYIILNLTLLSVNNIFNNKYNDKNIKYIGHLVDSIENNNIIIKLFNIEKNILKNYNEYFDLNKTPIYTIYNSFNGGIKIYDKINKNSDIFICRISGIWETSDKIGLTYKIESITP
jgi:hypothetical protein